MSSAHSRPACATSARSWMKRSSAALSCFASGWTAQAMDCFRAMGKSATTPGFQARSASKTLLSTTASSRSPRFTSPMSSDCCTAPSTCSTRSPGTSSFVRLASNTVPVGMLTVRFARSAGARGGRLIPFGPMSSSSTMAIGSVKATRAERSGVTVSPVAARSPRPASRSSSTSCRRSTQTISSFSPWRLAKSSARSRSRAAGLPS